MQKLYGTEKLNPGFGDSSMNSAKYEQSYSPTKDLRRALNANPEEYLEKRLGDSTQLEIILMLTMPGINRPVKVKKVSILVNDSWKYVSERALNKHLVKGHFSPLISDMFEGIAQYDIELAAVRGFRLDEAVRGAYAQLERPTTDIEAEIASISEKRTDISANSYRVLIVKNLRYIDQLGLAQVDWARVSNSVEALDSISLKQSDLETDPFKIFWENKGISRGGIGISGILNKLNKT